MLRQWITINHIRLSLWRTHTHTHRILWHLYRYTWVSQYWILFIPQWTQSQQLSSITLRDQMFTPRSIQCLHFAYAKFFQIFIKHLPSCHVWSTLTIRATEFWIFHTKKDWKSDKVHMFQTSSIFFHSIDWDPVKLFKVTRCDRGLQIWAADKRNAVSFTVAAGLHVNATLRACNGLAQNKIEGG